MLRVFTFKKINTAHMCRIIQNCSSLSTIPNQKLVIQPISKWKKPKGKLKAKPYEELLKVLETLEHSLKSEHSMNVKCNAAGTPLIKSSAKTTDPYSYEATYTVKHYAKTISNEDTSSDVLKKDKVNCKTKYSKKGKQIHLDDIRRLTKNANALRALKSYVEVNINADEVEKVQDYLRKQLKHLESRYKMKNIMEIDIYNTLISGWAQKGKLDKIKHLFSLMATDKIDPNLQSYAGYFEGISRSKFIDVDEIHNVVNDMQTKGLSHRDILQKCIFKNDQREKVIEVLGFVDPDIDTTLPMEKGDSYSCKLLEKLNDKSYKKSHVVPDFCFKKEDIPLLTLSQIEVEERYSIKIKSVDSCGQESAATLKSRKNLQECVNSWRKMLSAAIKNFKSFEKRYHLQGFCKRESIYPYISVIDTDVLVNLLLQEVRLLAETSEFFSPMERVLCKELGYKVMIHYFIWLNKKNKVTDKVIFIYQQYLHYLLQPRLVSECTPREYWEYLKQIHCEGPTIDMPHAVWPHGVIMKIGTELYSILQKNIAINESMVNHKKKENKFSTQAFYTHYEEIKGVKIAKHIGTHPSLSKLYRNAKLDYLEFDATLLPMLCPPKPWIKSNSGGLLVITTPFIRLSDNATHQTNHYADITSKELNPSFDSLNSLSCCPWIINKCMLDLVIDVFQKGGNETLDIPLNPNSFAAPEKINSSMSKVERHSISKQNKELKKSKCETTSLWFDCLYKLSIANHFRDKVFWFPHNLDFRGRSYPTPPHFNHLGSDMARSILLFAEGKPLGRNGLDWLKIQLINLTGFKKREPHSVRLQFANENIPEILDSADRPFEGNQWWRTSDEPWQTLACCKELANALRHPNPEEYVSHYPVHQDGSCNGLQHYAALGRDSLGAIEVNLEPANAPHDVYSGVCALVERERQKDAASGDELAKVLEGFIKRKVVKQTVMTFVYGVTKHGAKLQILKQLKDIPTFPEKYYSEASRYLMEKIFLSIKEMFTATQQIQDWFNECAEHVTRVSGDCLEWVTPLGLPVIQPYRKKIILQDNKFIIPFGKESCFTYSSSYEPYQLPDTRKQKNGFAPNFIHSLDASHMMLTSLFCQRYGFTFVSVHDCYWTHAACVEIMNEICREQFVALHKEPILEDLSKFFLQRYSRVIDENLRGKKQKKNVKLKDIVSAVPRKGTFNLDKVLESEYFFS